MSTMSTAGGRMRSFLTGLAKLGRTDSVFHNETAGFTSDRDKTQAWAIGAGRRGITCEAAEVLYHFHPEARAIVRKPVDHAFRRGFELRITGEEGDGSEDQDREAAVTEALDALKAIDRLRDADTWGRLYGGCLVIMGADDGRAPDRELDEGNLKAIRFLNVVDRRSVSIHQRYADPTLPNFGEPELYRVTAHIPGHGGRAIEVGTVVHESRVLAFGGAPTSAYQKAQNCGWDLSVLDPVRDVLKDYEAAWRATSGMMADKSVRVFLLQGVAEMLDSNREEGKAGVNARMALVDRGISIVRGIILDKDGEDMKYVDRNLTGVPEVVERQALRLAGAAEMPFTVLFGDSPSGMDATGESDLQLWDDRVEAHQTGRVQPQLERLIRLLFLAKEGPTAGVEPDGWSIAWHPLRQMSEKEKAEVRKLVAEADSIYIADQVLTPQQVALARFGGEVWSMETTVDRGALEAILEADKRYALTVTSRAVTTPEAPALPAGGPEMVPEGAVSAAAAAAGEALNGAQVTALVMLLQEGAARRLPRDSALELIEASFPITREVAERIMGAVGTTFFSGVDAQRTDGLDIDGIRRDALLCVVGRLHHARVEVPACMAEAVLDAFPGLRIAA